MKNWLDRCESVCCPDTDLLCVDKVKLRNELLNVQVRDLSVCFTQCLSRLNHPHLLNVCYCFTCTGNAEGDTVPRGSPSGSGEPRGLSVSHSS